MDPDLGVHLGPGTMRGTLQNLSHQIVPFGSEGILNDSVSGNLPSNFLQPSLIVPEVADRKQPHVQAVVKKSDRTVGRYYATQVARFESSAAQ